MENSQKSTLSQVLIAGLNALPSGVIIWTNDDTLVFSNSFFSKHIKDTGMVLWEGMSRFELVQKSIETGFLKLAEGLDLKKYIQNSKEIMRREGVFERELALSEDRVFLLTNQVLDSNHYLQLYTDISKLKAHEKEIAEKERRYSSVAQALNAFVFEWDILTDKTTFSMPECIGPTSDQLPEFNHKEGFSYVYEADREPYSKALDRHLEKRTPLFDFEHRIVSDGGKINWYRTRGKADWNSEGRAVKLNGFVENIEQKKQFEKRIKDIQKQSYDALNSVTAGIMVWDADDRMVLFNSFFSAFGVNFEIGSPYAVEVSKLIDAGIFIIETDKDEWINKRVKSRYNLVDTEITMLPPLSDGSRLQITSKRLKDGSLVQVFVDVTELSNRETELERLVSELEDARQKADAANQTKSQFLANMSHELRTPLNAIIGLTEMLKEDCVEDKLDDFLEPLDRVFNAGKHLLTLINDVLDLSKIEAGRVELYNETFALAPVLEEIIRTTRPLIEANRNKIRLEIAGDVTEITSDQTRIKQVFLNLISNATKFTEGGEIALIARRVPKDNGDLIAVDVRDTGIGMTEVQIGRLFNAFVQADSSTTRKYGGTGLGLTISKQLTQLMGGDVTVQSVPNQGTTFTASFRINNTEAVTSAPARLASEPSMTRLKAADQPNGKTVLIIDDDPTISELMQRHLVRGGYRVQVASSGKAGLTLARELKPDVITLDILMPEIDGWSILRSLKADPELSTIPVIMASIIDEKNKGFALGAADFLSKPVEREHLISAVQNLIGEKKEARICIVEDDDNLRFAIKESLEKWGANVILAANGREALDLLADASDPPDLILLDLLMPVMNGFDFLQEIRRTALKSTPVLVLTGADLTTEESDFLSRETLRVIEKSDDSVASIANAVGQAIRTLTTDH